jgi:hypothetical protein
LEEDIVKLYYETPSLWESLMRQIYPPVTLVELQIFDASTQHHVKQIERMRVPQVDSAAGRAIPMMAILTEPGKYYADGAEVLLIENMPDSKMVL